MKRVLSTLGALLIGLFLAVNTIPASAAEAPVGNQVVPPDASTGLSINPRKNLIMNPGQTTKDVLIVANLSNQSSLAINIRVVDFTFFNNTGTPKLMLSPTAANTPWSLKPFLTIPSHEVIGPSQSLDIPYSVTIPANQGAGSYYSAIEYSAAGTGGGNVGLNASGVSLMFVTVTGQVHENLVLQKFGAYQQGNAAGLGTYTWIALHKPELMAYTLKNNGNVAENPSGSINIKYMFGKTILIPNINIDSDLALIGQTRLFTTCIVPVKQSITIQGAPTKTTVCGPTNLWPGRYSATINAYYGQNGNPTQEIVGTASFWYLPTWFIIAFCAVLLIIILVIWWIVRKIRQRIYGKKHRNRGFGRRR